jgi:hypothetical protein
MQDEKHRTKRIEIRLTIDEKRRLQQLVDSSEFSSVAALFRDLVLNESDFSFDKKTPRIRKKISIQQDPDLVASVAKIGNNINQITRHVNAIARGGERFAAAELYAILENINARLEQLIKHKLDE